MITELLEGQISLSVPVETVLNSAIRLEVPVEFMRFCDGECLRERRFVHDKLCALGLIGHCTSCGVERIAPFTRVNSEAA